MDGKYLYKFHPYQGLKVHGDEDGVGQVKKEGDG
jgi:hypothetical protein